MSDFLKKDDRKVVNVNDIDDLIGKVEIIDIREPYEYKSESLEGSKNIPMGNLLANPDKYLVKDKTYYIICKSGVRSEKTAKVLTKQGFDVIDVTDGISSYVGTKKIMH